AIVVGHASAAAGALGEAAVGAAHRTLASLGATALGAVGAAAGAARARRRAVEALAEPRGVGHAHGVRRLVGARIGAAADAVADVVGTAALTAVGVGGAAAQIGVERGRRRAGGSGPRRAVRG